MKKLILFLFLILTNLFSTNIVIASGNGVSWIPDGLNYMLSPHWSDLPSICTTSMKPNGHVTFSCRDGGYNRWAHRVDYLSLTLDGPLYYVQDGQTKTLDTINVTYTLRSEYSGWTKSGQSTLRADGTEQNMFVIDMGQMIYGVAIEYTLELPPAFTTTGGTGLIGASKKPKYRHHWSWNYVNEKWWAQDVTIEPFTAEEPALAMNASPSILSLKQSESASVDVKVTSNVDKMWRDVGGRNADITVSAVDPVRCPLTLQGIPMGVSGSVVTLQTNDVEDGVQAVANIQAYGNGTPGEYMCNLILTASLK
ncbi:hypothetical protein QWO17_005129 [Escherichia coli]|nr:hypothetical protein [Escherichia coli]ELO5043808.1 hypothetical protein [Escherichia coli]ELO5139100.1 hypothetical protein [Escherichia coli]ELP4014384.1 hypothetical protein [Escherichia coli]